MRVKSYPERDFGMVEFKLLAVSRAGIENVRNDLMGVEVIEVTLCRKGEHRTESAFRLR